MPEPISINEHRTRPAMPGRPVSPGHRLTRTGWSLTADSFEKFMRWLSPDRDEAGRKYEQLRKELVKVFTWRCCHTPEELFDTVVDRVVKKLESGTVDCRGDALAYCRAVARFVLREYWRQVKLDPMPEETPLPNVDEPDWDERELECLNRCLGQLRVVDRDLITLYYQGEGRERIRIRKALASEVGGMNALRIRVYRIRVSLRELVFESVRRLEQEKGKNNQISATLSSLL